MSITSVLPAAAAAGGGLERFTGLRFVGASPRVRIVGLHRLPGAVNYFIGNDPHRWLTDVPTFAEVAYLGLYPGVDLVFQVKGGKIEDDWVVRPGTDPREIRVRLTGPSRRAALDRVPRGGRGTLVRSRPLIYQQTPAGRRLVSGRYVLRAGRQIGLAIGPYDRSRPLIVDPSWTYSTYLGGSGDDGANGIAVDAAGNAYVTGYTSSTDFPTSGGEQAGYGGPTLDAFVARLSADGGALLYSTFLGGSGTDVGQAIALDASGNAYVAGSTTSLNFPTVNALQKTPAGGTCANASCSDAFVAKLSATGSSLLYSTYLGGDGDDVANGIAVDAAGSAFVSGETRSTNFPVAGGMQRTFGGGSCRSGGAAVPCADAFVARLSPAGNALVYSTYLGGKGEDAATAVALDGAGDAYVTGYTNSADFPIASALQSKLGAGSCSYGACYDAFVAELNPGGSSLVYSTYLGGSDEDMGYGIAVDAAGNAYVAGQTRSRDFPTSHAVQPAPGGGTCASAPCSDAFVAKLSKGDSALVYGTYLGGKGDDVARGIAVDQAGEATVTGSTGSSDFPVYGAQQAAFGGGQSDAFITRLSQTGSALVYSTYLGGSSSDEGLAIALDRAGDAFVAGRTASGDFPVASALQAGIGGRTDAFVARVGGALTPTPAASAPAASASLTPAGTSTVTPLPSATPTRTPGPSPTPVTEVSVISVRIEKIRARADWQLEHPSMKRAWVGTTVLLSIYYAVTHAHPADQVTARWSVSQGGRVVYRRVARRRLNSPTAGLYRIKTRFTPRRLGTYVYVGRVTVRGTADAGTTTVTAVSRPAGRRG